MGKRRKSRECALQALFMWDITGDLHESVFDFAQHSHTHTPSNSDLKTYSRTLCEGVIEHRDAIDLIIRKYSKHWKLERMGIVDRNILRLAIFELMYIEGVPKAVVINEAVEIAKIYGDKDSPIFINGNLDQVFKKEIQPEKEDTSYPETQEPIHP